MRAVNLPPQVIISLFFHALTVPFIQVVFSTNIHLHHDIKSLKQCSMKCAPSHLPLRQPESLTVRCARWASARCSAACMLLPMRKAGMGEGVKEGAEAELIGLSSSRPVIHQDTYLIHRDSTILE